MDRFGVFHEFGSVADLPDAIAPKLVIHGLGAYAPGPAPAPDAADETSTTEIKMPRRKGGK
jgi:hypothetical protein